MTISAKVIADSVAEGCGRITTIQCRYPRFIHAEAKTHRVMRIDDAEYEFLQEISLMDDENLSRNASSSRAIPVQRMIRDVLEDPAMPVAWGSNKPGMQAGEECENLVKFRHDEVPREAAWLRARDNAVTIAKGFADAGYHKQIINRLLEPFGHISVVVTATEWDNFFDLRRHPDADPTMKALADAIWDVREASEPKELFGDLWHLPYIDQSDINTISEWLEDPEHGAHHLDFLPRISAARCARVSYLNHDGSSPDLRKDLNLAEKLLTSKHMSPFEHQARPTTGLQDFWGNFQRWDQNRRIIELAA